MSEPRILTIDIETSPNLAHVWGLWQQNVSLSQLMQATQVICFAAKWHGEKKILFASDHHNGHAAMIAYAHELLDEADIVVHYNGNSFDMPHLRRELLLAGLPPPSPWKDVDLLRVVKSRFRFISNKLQNVTTELGMKGKLSHSGHDLWVRCMAGDDKAWATMRRYNMQDVRVTEELYDRLLPWIPAHPHRALYSGQEAPSCGRCGSSQLQRRGCQVTPTGRFQRFQCQGCGGWSRAGKSDARVDVRPV